MICYSVTKLKKALFKEAVLAYENSQTALEKQGL